MNFENEKFLRVYKFLFENEKFNKLSTDGKIIYSLMLERNDLSIQNNLKDEIGYYIIMKNKEVQSILNCGEQKAVRIFKELENLELIKKRKKKFNSPNLIYLNSIELKPMKITDQYCENHNNNNTNKINSKIDISKTNIQSGALAPDNKGDVKITTQEQEQLFKIPLKNGEYYILCQEQVDIYKNLYPNINIEQELKNIIGWNLSNVNKRKTIKGINNHINSWLQKSNSNALEKQENFNQKEKCVNVVYEPNYSKDDFLSL